MITDVLFLFCISLVPIVWLKGGFTIFGYDSGFRLSGLTYIRDLLYSWNPTVNFGADWSIYRAMTVLQFPEALLSQIFGLSIAQMVLFVGWFFIIGVSMYVLLRNIFPESKFRFFRIFSSVFYVFNFFILNGWLNAERAKLSLYAALPIAILLLYRQAFGNQQLMYGTVAFGLLYAIFNGGGSPPLYGATLVSLAVAAFVFFLGVWRQKGKRAALKTFGSYLLFGVSFVLFNFYWLLPLAGLARQSYASSVASQGGIGGLIEWEKVFSKNASFLNVFRLQGFPDWYDNPLHPYANAFISNPLLVIVSFLPLFSIFIGVLLFGTRSEKRKYFVFFLFLLLCAGMVMTAGSHPPTGYVYIFFMRYVPGFAIFRSGFYKFAPDVWFPIIILSGYYLALAIDRYFQKKYLGSIIWMICILGIIAYHYPFFQTKSFTINGIFSSRVSIPNYVYELQHVIQKKTTANDRILILPDLDPGYITLPMDAYSWKFFSADILPRVITERSFIAGDSNDDAAVKLLYGSIYTGDSARFLKLAHDTGITYILWRGDVLLSSETEKLRPLSDVRHMLVFMPGITEVAKSGPWELYKINGDVLPMVSVATNPIYVTGSARGDVLFAGHSVVMRTTPDQNQNALELIGTECIMCDPNEFAKFEESIYLPPQDNKITSQLKRIIRIFRRQQNVLPQSDGEMIDRKLSELLSTVSSEVRSNDTSQTGTVTDAIGIITEFFSRLSGRDRIVYANRLYAYMLALVRLTKGGILAPGIQSGIDPLKEKITRAIFMTDDSVFRYMVTLRSDGSYRIVDSDTHDQYAVDGSTVSPLLVYLKKGFHTVEVARNGRSEAPYVFFTLDNLAGGVTGPVSFTRISSTLYEGSMNVPSTESSVLVLNQRFDPRWQLTLTVNGGKRQVNQHHVEVNGFANGWILDKGTTENFEIVYVSRTYDAIGRIVSLATLLISGVGFMAWRMWCRTNG